MTSKIGDNNFYNFYISPASQHSECVQEQRTQEYTDLFTSTVKTPSSEGSRPVKRNKQGKAKRMMKELAYTPGDPENRSDFKFENMLFTSRRTAHRLSKTSQYSLSPSALQFPVESSKASQALTKKITAKATTTQGKKRKREEIQAALNSMATKKLKINAESVQQEQPIAQEYEYELPQPPLNPQNSQEIHPLKKQPASEVKSVSEGRTSELASTQILAAEISVYKEADCLIIPLPYAADSYDKACENAIAMHTMQIDNPTQTNRILTELLKTSRKNPEMIRVGKSDHEHVKRALFSYIITLNKFTLYQDHASKPEDDQKNIKVKIFEFKNGHYELCHTQNPSGQHAIHLYRKNKSDNTPHYDILISQNLSAPFSL